MKKTLTLMSSAVVLLGAAATTHAAPILLEDTIMFSETGIDSGELLQYGGNRVNGLDYGGDTVKWVHQYSFLPAVDYLIRGTLTLSLRDDNDMAGDYGLLFTESESTWRFGGEIDSGEGFAFDLDLGSLADGQFMVLLKSTLGDFTIDKSVLSIEYMPVSEPGTLVLLGSGLLGLVAARKKRKFS